MNDYFFARWNHGETIVSKRYNYTQYYGRKTGAVKSSMLYARRSDPAENINIASIPENKSVVEKLSGMLEKHVNERR